jgi:D-tyrosyl-tRNA(Tyr) deacylase
VKAVLQRVLSARVCVNNTVHSKIGKGAVIFLGVEKQDKEEDVEKLARKIANLRIFEDSTGKMNLSIKDIRGEFLVVSQFTLCADLSGGNRPGFDPAMPPEEAKRLYENFWQRLKDKSQVPVTTGLFGEHMIIELENDGPVTFILST